MNSNSIFTRRHAGADAAASVSAPATTSAAAEDAFKNDPTATLEGVRGKVHIFSPLQRFLETDFKTL